MSTVRPLRLKPMHERPRPGRLTVWMKDGRCLECTATMIHAGERSGIVIYHGGTALDERGADGWTPNGGER